MARARVKVSPMLRADLILDRPSYESAASRRPVGAHVKSFLASYTRASRKGRRAAFACVLPQRVVASMAALYLSPGYRVLKNPRLAPLAKRPLGWRPAGTRSGGTYTVIGLNGATVRAEPSLDSDVIGCLDRFDDVGWRALAVLLLPVDRALCLHSRRSRFSKRRRRAIGAVSRTRTRGGSLPRSSHRIRSSSSRPAWRSSKWTTVRAGTRASFAPRAGEERLLNRRPERPELGGFQEGRHLHACRHAAELARGNDCARRRHLRRNCEEMRRQSAAKSTTGHLLRGPLPTFVSHLVKLSAAPSRGFVNNK